MINNVYKTDDFKNHYKLVEKISYKYYSKLCGNIPLDDLKGYGYIGLAEAYNKYDENKGNLSFSKYLGWCIKNSILTGITEYTKRLGGETYFKKYKAKETIQNYFTNIDDVPGIYQMGDVYDSSLVKNEIDQLFCKISEFVKVNLTEQDYNLFYDYYLSGYFNPNASAVKQIELSKKYKISPANVRYRLALVVEMIKKNFKGYLKSF